MPYKFESTQLIPKEHDLRIKLLDTDKEDIVKLFNEGVSKRELARTYSVSRRLIDFIVCPEKKLENLARRAENGGSSKYYDKDAHRNYMKSYRTHKKELFIACKTIRKEYIACESNIPTTINKTKEICSENKS